MRDVEHCTVRKKGFEVSISHLSRDPKLIYSKSLKRRCGEEKAGEGAHLTPASLCPPICQHLVPPGECRSLPTTPVLVRKMGSAASCPDLVLIALVPASPCAKSCACTEVQGAHSIVESVLPVKQARHTTPG